MHTQQHIIKKLVLDLNLVGSQQTAFAQQAVLKQALLQSITKEIGQIPATEATIRIPQLAVNLGTITQAEFGQKLSELLPILLKRLIQNETEKQAEKSVQHLSAPQKNKQLFFSFLKEGHFPWWAKNTDWAEWEMAVVPHIDQIFIDTLKKQLTLQPEGIYRLIQQFSPMVLNRLVEILHQVAEIKQPLNAINSKKAYQVFFEKAILNKNRQEKGQVLLQKTNNSYLSNGNSPRFKQKEETSALSTDILQSQLTKPNAFYNQHKIQLPKSLKSKQKVLTDAPTSEYFINNAGLVILLPYFPILLKEFGYLTGAFINQKYQEKAVLLSQYLVTGKQENKEINLVLNKIACGWKLTQPLASKIALTKKQKIFIDTFLKEIIQHWGALKNTSPDGLRNNFLKRNGKLTYVNGHWKLLVEKVSYDSFLLKKLPWTISIIKSKFMHKRIHVEWI